MYGPSAPIPPILGPSGYQYPEAVYYDHGFVGGSNRFSTTADAGEWLLTTDNSGTVRKVDGATHGVLRSLPGTAANDFNSCQMNGEDFALSANRNILFKMRIRTNDADDIKFFVGLASTDVTGTTAGPILDGVNDCIGFRNTAGNTTTFHCITEDDTNETTTNANAADSSLVLADDTWIELAFEVVNRTSVTFWVNGKQVAKHTTNLPDSGAAMTLTFEVGSPTGTTATYLDYDWIIVAIDGQAA